MPINKLIIENFKGIKDRQEFVIRPLTIFCGPNSSGKSSCIHALAALAQTTKLAASQMPIVLDDEYAQVHLGRFMDVLHSKSMKDAFTIGITVNKPSVLLAHQPPKAIDGPPCIQAEYSFRAKAKTQEVYIQKAELAVADQRYVFDRRGVSPTDYSISTDGKKLPFVANPTGRLALQVRMEFKKDQQPSNEEMAAFLVNENINRTLSTELRRTLYLGPFRQGPLRKYPTRGSQPTEVGAAGESAVTMLANEFARSKTKHPNLAKVSGWISELGLGKKLQVQPVAKTDLVDVSVTLNDGAELPLPDLGYGVSQVLPVLVQCAFAPKNSTLLFEQPELHLHEAAAKNLATVFLDIIREKSVHIVAETHSRHLFLEVMRQVSAGRISPDDVVLYDVTRGDGKSAFREVKIIKDEEGYCEAEHPWAKGLEQNAT
ncbi:MAG: AAA family ATPase [Candidatus Accumulibacter sp.]|uniref:AAA family ATPase n=1 Tax=Accumulibacter sp. TaxID=2053492 RepID=UPI002588FDCF|nr:AAA family ATPase [Accumulibacter sp.]MCM8620629.1 AAA family ATPase [Accumulibacter sp.]